MAKTQPDPIEHPLPANRGLRLGAMLLDAGICLFIGGFLGAVLRIFKISEASLGSATVQIALILGFGVFPFVSLIKSASPGKLILGLRIANSIGMNVPVWKIFLRETVVKAVGFIALGPIWIFLNKGNRAIWDLALGTYVVPERRLSRPPENEILEDIPDPLEITQS